MRRGDVVLVHIPYVEGPSGKKRPVLVLQGDEYNANLPHTIVAAISSNLRGIKSPTQLLIDPLEPEGRAAGVLHRSSIRCDRLFTVAQSLIGRTLGHLNLETMVNVEDCLRSSLGLPARSNPGSRVGASPESRPEKPPDGHAR